MSKETEETRTCISVCVQYLITKRIAKTVASFCKQLLRKFLLRNRRIHIRHRNPNQFAHFCTLFWERKDSTSDFLNEFINRQFTRIARKWLNVPIFLGQKKLWVMVQQYSGVPLSANTAPKKNHQKTRNYDDIID